MELETIKSKLKKIAALAERGVGGEKENAKRLLEPLLKKHGLKIEDVIGVDQERRKCWFKATKGEIPILMQCFARVMNQTSVEFYRGGPLCPGEIAFDLTRLDEIEMRAMWYHFQKLFRREVRKLMAEHRKQFELLNHAFVQKHDLYSAKSDEGGGKHEPLSRKDLMRLMSLMADLEDSNYVSTRRMLEGGCRG